VIILLTVTGNIEAYRHMLSMLLLISFLLAVGLWYTVIKGWLQHVAKVWMLAALYTL
jgi:hypothetical protein